jgi:tetratricopeptide (TPR) repeat protein
VTVLRTALGLVLIASFALGIFALHTDLRELQLTYPDEYRSYFVPSSAQMKVMCLGYRNLSADLLFLWSIQRYDWYSRSVRWDYLEHTFDVITDLDPKYQDAYIVGALFAFMGLKWDVIYAIEDKGTRLNPENYIIPYDAGCTALFSEKNYERAVKYLRIAHDRNPNHPFLQTLLARAYRFSGDPDSSLAFWREIYNRYKDQTSPESGYYRGTAGRYIWDTLIDRDRKKVRTAVEAFRGKRGEIPPTLRSLVLEGLLPEIPLDPAGKRYEYDAATGEITCTSPFDVKAAMGQW